MLCSPILSVVTVSKGLVGKKKGVHKVLLNTAHLQNGFLARRSKLRQQQERRDTIKTRWSNGRLSKFFLGDGEFSYSRREE